MNVERRAGDEPKPASMPDLSGAARDDEPLGGDPPCWAHLFGEDPGSTADDMSLSEPLGGVTPLDGSELPETPGQPRGS